MPQSQHLSSVIPFAAIERPACPKCKAQMMLVSIEPARARGVDLQTFECAVCNQGADIWQEGKRPAEIAKPEAPARCGERPPPVASLGPVATARGNETGEFCP